MTALKDKIYDVLTACPCLLGWSLVMDRENGAKAPRPFALIEVLDNVRTPWQEGKIKAPAPAPALGARLLTARETFQLRLSMYGATAMHCAERLAFELTETDAAQILNNQKGIGWSTQSEAIDLPELRDDLTYEPRVVFTIRGNHVLSYVESLAIIEAVNVELDNGETTITEP